MTSKTSGTFNGAGQTSAVIVGRETEAILTGSFVATVVPEVQDSARATGRPMAGESLHRPGRRDVQTRHWR